MNKEQIGLRIKLERTKQNLTQEQLAEMADISSSYLSAIERGKQSISLDYTNRIAEALKIPVIDFLTHEPESRYGMEEKPAGTDKMAVSNVERKRKMAELEEIKCTLCQGHYDFSFSDFYFIFVCCVEASK